MTFKKTLLAASLAAMSMAAVAQVTGDASKDAAETAASTDWALTANVNLASSYRFRGIDQTFNQPAIQGGFDLTMPYGFYVGNWNSNVTVMQPVCTAAISRWISTAAGSMPSPKTLVWIPA